MSRRQLGPLLAVLLAALPVLGLGFGMAAAQSTGPAPVPGGGTPPDEILSLRQRTAEYWAARIARDYRTQWALSEPRLKGKMTPEEYGAGKGAIQYLGYEVGDARINGAFAVIDVKVIAKVTIARRPAEPLVRTAKVEDGWVKVDGIWYRRADQPEPSGAGPGKPEPSGEVPGRPRAGVLKP